MNKLHELISLRLQTKRQGANVHIPFETSAAMIMGFVAFQTAQYGAATLADIKEFMNLSYLRTHQIVTRMTDENYLDKCPDHFPNIYCPGRRDWIGYTD